MTVRVGHSAKPIQVQAADALPTLEFELMNVGFPKCTFPLTDAGLEHLRGLTNLVAWTFSAHRLLTPDWKTSRV